MPSSHLILYHPLILLPPIPPSISHGQYYLTPKPSRRSQEKTNILNEIRDKRYQCNISKLNSAMYLKDHMTSIRVVSSAYLRLLIFLLAILIPACATSSPAFLMMSSAYRLNKQGDNMQVRKQQLELDMEHQTGSK